MFILKMSLEGLIKFKKRTLVLFAIIFLLVLGIVGVNSISVTNTLTEQYRLQKTTGKWQYAVYDGSFEESHTFDLVGSMYHLGSKDNMVIGSFDQTMMDLSVFTFLKGRFPQNQQELIVTESNLAPLGLEYGINQDLTLLINGIEQTFTVVGVIQNYQKNWPVYEVLPTIITTNMTSDHVSVFGYSEIPRYIESDTYYKNEIPYPMMSDPNGPNYATWWMGDKAVTSQRKTLSQAFEIMALFTLFTMYRFSSDFYSKKIKMLRHLGISRIQSAFYIIIHTIIYGLITMLSFKILGLLIPKALSLVPETIAGIDHNVLKQSTTTVSVGVMVLHLLVNSKVLIEPLVPSFNLPSKRGLLLKKGLSYTLILAITIGFVSMISVPIMEIVDQAYPDYRWSIDTHSSSYNYRVQEPNLSKDFVKEYLEGTNNFKVDTIPFDDWSRLVNHESVESYQAKLAVSVLMKNPEDTNTNEFSTVSFIYLDEVKLNTLKSTGLKVSDDFISGKTFIELKYDEDSPISNTGDLFRINERHDFILESDNIIPPEVELGSGYYISQEGMERLGYDINTVSHINLSLNIEADADAYDHFIYKNASKYWIDNEHVNHDLLMVQYSNILQLLFVQCVLYLFFGAGLIVSSLVNEGLERRKEIGLKKLLGFSTNDLVRSFSLKFIIIMFFSIIPAFLIGHKMYLTRIYNQYVQDAVRAQENVMPYREYLSQFINKGLGDGFYLNVILSLIIILVVISLLLQIIAYIMVKPSPFELIDEKE